MTAMHPTQRALVDAVQAELARLQTELGPIMDARPEPQFRDPEYRAIQPAQNTLRTCLEAVLSALTPYTHMLIGELAIRLASYSISAAPLEDQDQMMANVIQLLPPAHSQRVAQGIIINTTWEQNGLFQPNVPGGRA